MAVFQPTYKDPKTGEVRKQAVWWVEFLFAGKRIRESTKSTRKTIAVEYERNRRRELERTYNGIDDKRAERIRSIQELATAFLADYEIRNPQSATFARYGLRHICRLLGTKLAAEVGEDTIKRYQTDRLQEGASAKSINDEVIHLLRLLEEQGDLLRARMKRKRTLKLKVQKTVGKAWTEEERRALLEAARARRSPSIVPALLLSLHCGLRDAELRNLQWGRVDLERAILTVGRSKTDAGEGRTIPLNSAALRGLVEHAQWFLGKFGATDPEWYVFPFGKPQPTDPTRPVTTLKTVWSKVRKDAGLSGRWHDNRHTFITTLAESGEASDETIRDLAGHVAKDMLKHYSHIRMEAKRRAVAALTLPTVKPDSDGVPLKSPKVMKNREVQ